jgi:hypothetical protein
MAFLGHHEILGGTFNIVLLSTFYTIVGLLMSIFLFHAFDDCNEEWKAESVFYQLGDIFIELGIIGTVSFWTTSIITDYAPIFPISKTLDIEIDKYISSLFFAFAMFLFLEELTLKVKHLYHTYIHVHIVSYIPENWSVMKMLFGSLKTNTKKASN